MVRMEISGRQSILVVFTAAHIYSQSVLSSSIALLHVLQDMVEKRWGVVWPELLVGVGVVRAQGKSRIDRSIIPYIVALAIQHSQDNVLLPCVRCLCFEEELSLDHQTKNTWDT